MATVAPPAETPQAVAASVGDAPADTPTGLTVDELGGLVEHDLEALAVWHLEHAGDDEGRPWWGNAIRRLALDHRLRLASDPELTAGWEELERRRCTNDVAYFVEGYGHVQPEEGGPEPFSFWPEQPGVRGKAIGSATQAEVLALFVASLRVVVLKARQLGMTWLALHYGVWLMVFNPATPNAKVLCLSKHGGDATKLLARARSIIRLLPPFLRPSEKSSTRSALQRLELEGGGTLISLAGTPEAARSETATLTLLDEAAFVRNKGFGPTLTAALPTLGAKGRAIILSTGNGPEEVPGDGQSFARLWVQARGRRTADPGVVGTVVEGDHGEVLDAIAASDAQDFKPIFLPASTKPGRDHEWRERERRAYLHTEDFEAEYPEDEGEALQGRSGIKVFLPKGMAAVEQLGAELDEQLYAGTLIPAGETIAVAVDFGEYQAWLPVWPLEDGGIYVPPGEVYGGGHVHMTVRDGCLAWLEATRAWRDPGEGVPPILVDELRYDAAGVESKHTAVEVFEETDMSRWVWAKRYKPHQRTMVKSPRTHKVAFAKWKMFTLDYLRWLVKRAAEGERTRVLAISPTNVVLLRQMRGLELMDDGSGRIEKGEDHMPDSLIAGAQKIARANQSMMPKLKQSAMPEPGHLRAA